MAAAGLLAENPSPTEDQVRHALEGNLCRCTGYHNIVKAVLDASKSMSGVGRRAAGGDGMSTEDTAGASHLRFPRSPRKPPRREAHRRRATTSGRRCVARRTRD